MCGLVGIAKTSEHKAWDDLMNSLLFFDQFRGVHSTGIASINAEGGCSLFKRAVRASDFLDYPLAQQVVAQAARFKMGHNRQATQGSINNANAHPYAYENIILAHNGTLRGNWRNLLQEAPDSDTDSACLAYTMNVLGPEAVLAMELEGAFALTWYDRNKKDMNLLHNGERPLSIARVTFKAHKNAANPSEGIVWASEQWMIRAAAERIGMTVSEMFPLEKGDWWKIIQMERPDNKCKVLRTKKVSNPAHAVVSWWERQLGRKGYDW